MSDTEFRQEIARLQFQVATLEQLLQVHERTTVEQAERVEQAMAVLQETKVQNEFHVAALEQLLAVHEATVFATSQVEEARAHALLNAIPDMMFRLDKDGVFADFKAQPGTQLALPPEAFLGKKITNVMPPEVGRLTMNNASKVLATGQLATFEYQLPIGETLGTYEARMVPAGGQEVLVIVRDVTERKQLEQQIQGSLERRGAQVQTSTEVAQEIAAAPALDELFRRVVTLIKERFGYYHAQIFRYEPALNAVLLVVGYGEAGEKMLAAGHRLAMGRGVVGTAATTGRAVLAADVTQEEGWQPNPNLPDTKGELAVPIKLREEVLGILDVQSDKVGALTQDDQLLLEGLCGQIAVAVESTRLRQEMEERLRELNAMYRATAREGWQAMRETAALPKGYLFDRTDIQLAEDLWLPEIGRAVGQNALVAPSGEAGRSSAAVAPLAVRGEIIGALGVYDDPQQPMSPDDLELVQSVSEQVALALESARLFEEARTRAEEMAALNELSQRLTARLGVAGLLEETWWGAARLMDATNFSIALYDEDRDEISFPLDIADGKSTGENVILSSSRGMTGYIIRNRQPVLIKENAAEWRAEREIEPIGSRLGALSWLGAPMIIGDRVLGVLAVQSYTAQHAYNEHDQDMLVAIASQAAIALQSARQFELAQTRAGREQMLREVLAVVNASQDLATSLPQIEHQLRKLAPLDTLALTVYTPGEPEYTIFAFLPETEGGQLVSQSTRMSVKGTCSGWVITQGQPRLDADLREEKLFMEDTMLAADGMASRLVLPLKLGEQVVGTLNLVSAQPGTYTEEHVSILLPVTEQMALALERARLLEETRAALAEVEATQRRYLREKWESYLASAAEAPTGYVDGPAGLVPAEEGGMPGPVSAGNVLSVPLKLRGEPIGVLEFYHEDASRAWSEDERALVEALADQAALALENARLLDETQSRAQREQLINEITARIRASMDMETILQTTTEELSRALNLSRARIRLGTGDGDGTE
jgi:GAF domain-containing protein/PAS domain-containing protein